MSKKDLVSMDFETFSRADLVKCGVHRYARDPSTEVLCLSWAGRGEEPDIFHPFDPPPHRLFDRMEEGYCAFNAEFEMEIWEEVCVKKMGWPKVDPRLWYDTQADGLALGLPAGLDAIASALDAKYQKDPIGKKLINKLCKPVKPTKKHPYDRWSMQDAMDDYLLLYDYCKQDVRTEQAVREQLVYCATEDGFERDLWLNTIALNRRGIPIDTLAMTAIQDKIEEKVSGLITRMYDLTEGVVTKMTQKARLKDFLFEKFGLALPNMQGATIAEYLDKKNRNEPWYELLYIYDQANYASIAKYKRMALQVCDDGTIKGNLKYHKAATGRDAGAGVQTQNMPRLHVKDPEFAVQCVIEEDLETVESIFGNVLELASALVRSMLKAEDRHVFFDADLHQIESRMRAWVCLEQDYLQAFRDGKDPYIYAAAGMFHKRYEDIKSGDPLRQAGKIADLACGFQGAHKTLISMGLNYGIVFPEDEAKANVKAFRAAHPKLVATWKAFGAAARDAILAPGTKVFVETNTKFFFFVQQNFLFMRLPSGRLLSFPFPKWEMWKMPWGDMQMCVTHWWVNTMAGSRWEKRGISGASLMQSAVQGLARDVIMPVAIRLDAMGYPTVLRQHDEILCHVPDNAAYTVDVFLKEFVKVPDWCPDLPLTADPWVGPRFKK